MLHGWMTRKWRSDYSGGGDQDDDDERNWYCSADDNCWGAADYDDDNDDIKACNAIVLHFALLQPKKKHTKTFRLSEPVEFTWMWPRDSGSNNNSEPMRKKIKNK